MVGPAPEDDPDDLVEQHLQHHLPGEPRLIYKRRKTPGIVNALNLARQHACCDYIARMDADDICEPIRLQQQLHLAKACDNANLIGSRVSIFSDDQAVLTGNREYETWLNQHTNAQEISEACFIESPLPHPTWFAHKAVWNKIGDYKNGDFPEDYDMILRAWLQNIPMIKPTPPLLLKWREHSNRLTRTDPRYRREAFTRLKAQAVADPRSGFAIDEGRRVWIAGTGRNARYWHDALESMNATVAGFVDLDVPKAKHSKRYKPVIRYADLLEKRGNDLLITAITSPAARDKLRTWCADHNLKTGVDVVFGG